MSDFQQLWQDADWRARVNEWTRETLTKQGIRMLGELQETQVRPWSIVLHTPTDGGKIYFKATPPDSAHELDVVAALAKWCPAAIPEVLGTEHTQGWWLARNGGESIRARLKETRNLSEWIRAIELYAQLQMDVARHIEELRSLHVPDRRPHTLPAQYNALLGDLEILRIDRDKGLTAQEYAQLQALAAPLAEWCAQLSRYNIPDSLHHGDLNSANVLERDGKYAFVDWGDCSLAHPFSSLRTVFVSIEIALDLADYDPATAPVRDAYLNTWTKYESPENVRAAFALAQRLSSLVSALSWYSGIITYPPEIRPEYEHVVPGLLKEILYADLSKYPFA